MKLERLLEDLCKLRAIQIYLRHESELTADQKKTLNKYVEVD